MRTIPDFCPDDLDEPLFAVFPGLVLRKDLMHLPYTTSLPCYVIEAMLRRYCADVFDDDSIREGLRFAGMDFARYVHFGSEAAELQRAIQRAAEYHLIDWVRLEPIAGRRAASYRAWFGSRFGNASFDGQLDPLLTAGVWCRCVVRYEPHFRKDGLPFPYVLTAAIPMRGTACTFEEYLSGRARFTREQWLDILVRSIGYDSSRLSSRGKLLSLVRLIPLVEKRYHLVEVGFRQRGKTFVCRHVSPYATVCTGKPFGVERLLGRHERTQDPGLVSCLDAICFDSIAPDVLSEEEVSLYAKYMQHYEGTSEARLAGEAGFVFTENIEYNPRSFPPGAILEHLFQIFPPELARDVRFQDGFAALLPGWEMPLHLPERFPSHAGLALDVMSEMFHRFLRPIENYGGIWERWFEAETGRWSDQDRRCVNQTFSGLTKLLFPNGDLDKEDAHLLLGLAAELRLRVLRQRVGVSAPDALSYMDRQTGVRMVPRLEEGTTDATP